MSAHRTSTTRALAGLAASLLLCVGLSACNGSDSSNDQAQGDSAAPGGAETTPAAETDVELTSNVKNPRAVPIDKDIRFEAVGGTLEKVVVRSGKGAELAGGITADDTAWEAKGRLEPGTTYTARAVTRTPGGTTKRATTTFRTVDLSLDQQTYPSVAPLNGESVGVGMPVIVSFDIAVQDKATIEKHLKVTSTPKQPGAWHWISDQEVHWRPRSYWRAGTSVDVDVDINSIPAGAGIYGQESRHVSFDIGDAHVYKVNMDTHQMRVFSNGSLLRTIPITTGEEPKFTTRSGVKVILEKFREKRMNSETIGIDRNSPDGYDIDDVEYAMRVTYSGEFVHAAPWSVGSQGSANVSHGCTGMSTANAAWLYNMTSRGDVVEYTGTDKPMTLTNGYGDWNLDFADWASGSALS